MGRLGRYAAILATSIAVGDVIGHVIFWVHQRRAS